MAAVFKSCVLICLILAYHKCLCQQSGDYSAIIESFDNYKKLDRSLAEWHFSLKRINKNDKIVVGNFTLKKPIFHPNVAVDTYILSNSKYVKYDLNNRFKDLCDNLFILFISEYFDGNVTWTENCTVTSGFMATKDDTPINMNDLAHVVYQRAFYGTFKFVMTVLNDANRIVMKFGWVAITRKNKKV